MPFRCNHVTLLTIYPFRPWPIRSNNCARTHWRRSRRHQTSRALEAVRVKFLGRGGTVTEWTDKMKSLPREEKPAVGKLLNEIRTAVTMAIETRAENFRAEKESAAVANIDISLPGTSHERGAIHPLTQMLDRSIGVFRRMGFALAEGPDIETNGIASTR